MQRQRQGRVKAFTDGACSGGTGIGGWAVVFCFNDKNEKQHVISGCERNTTNNRMELTAVVEALNYDDKRVREFGLEICSDSAYVVNAINQNWIKKWQANGWKTMAKEDVKNRDLWERLVDAIGLFNGNVVFTKVKGHSGNELNEIADKVATWEVSLLKGQESD